MATLELLIYPNEKLRKICPPVTQFGPELAQLADDMHEIMKRFQGCGLAATQVGRDERLFILDLSDDFSAPEVYINPKITQSAGKMLWNEACLSFPYVWAKTELKGQITMEYQDLDGNPYVIECSEADSALRCAALQHESAHLDGILYIDALSKLKRDRLLQKMEKSLRIYGRRSA